MVIIKIIILAALNSCINLALIILLTNKKPPRTGRQKKGRAPTMKLRANPKGVSV